MENKIATVGVNISQMSVTSIITTSKAAHIFSHTNDFSELHNQLSAEGVPFKWEQFADYSPLTFEEADDVLAARYPRLTPINRVYESELERSAFIK
jgi:hypothetical protein